MLANRLLYQHSAAERDARPVEAVVDAAAARVGEAPSAAAALVDALGAHGVRWACQLEQADADDWARFGASTGLKLAIKVELRSPSSAPGSVPSAAAPTTSAKISRARGDARRSLVLLTTHRSRWIESRLA